MFSHETGFHYWILVFLEMDPMMDEVKEMAEFKEIMNKIKLNFSKSKEEIRAYLEAQEVL